jgi:HTH-type transcriptional regulator/antitoxin HigA
MISNERQYKVARSQANKFEEALKNFKELKLIEQGIDPLLIKAQRDALTSQLEDLREEIQQYEVLSAGNITELSATTVAELGKKLIETRIAKRISQKDLANLLGMKEQQIQRYEQERYASASLQRLSEISSALNINFQMELSFGEAPQNSLDAPSKKFDYSTFPIKVMKQRHWLEPEQLGIKDRKPDLATMFNTFISAALEGAGPALLRQSTRGQAGHDQNALLAWKARIVWKARSYRMKPFRKERFDDLSWLASFKEFTLDEQGPALAVEYLRKKGIFVTFESHLPKTHLDGAAMLVDQEIPTIALTLRHDRLDNFWFVLLHELGHIIRHRDVGLVAGFFDDDDAKATDKLEREADEFAKSILLPSEVWLSSLIRFTQSEGQIVAFAKENRLSPAIIAGWIRRERGDFSVFKDLVGHGKVRRSLAKAGLLEASNVSGS